MPPSWLGLRKDCTCTQRNTALVAREGRHRRVEADALQEGLEEVEGLRLRAWPDPALAEHRVDAQCDYHREQHRLHAPADLTHSVSKEARHGWCLS
eukprot:1756451-Rhodomonas_salina.1